MLLLAIKFLYERNCKNLSKVKTNSNVFSLYVMEGFAFVFVFMFFIFYKCTFICFSLVFIWEGCSLTQILCPVAFVGI